MRNSLRFLTLFSLVLFGAAIANADERVNVPFNFVVNGKTLPAGTYIIRHLSFTNPNALLLDGGRNRILPLSASSVDVGKTGSQLLFDNEGEDRVLKSLATAHGTLSFAAPSSTQFKKGKQTAAAISR